MSNSEFGTGAAQADRLRALVDKLQRAVHEAAVHASPMFSVEYWKHNAGYEWPQEPDDDSYLYYENCQHPDCMLSREVALLASPGEPPLQEQIRCLCGMPATGVIPVLAEGYSLPVCDRHLPVAASGAASDPPVDVQAVCRALVNCFTLARRELARSGASDAKSQERWGHVLRICEEAGCRGQGVLRASVPTEITEGSAVAASEPQAQAPDPSALIAAVERYERAILAWPAGSALFPGNEIMKSARHYVAALTASPPPIAVHKEQP